MVNVGLAVGLSIFGGLVGLVCVVAGIVTIVYVIRKHKPNYNLLVNEGQERVSFYNSTQEVYSTPLASPSDSPATSAHGDSIRRSRTSPSSHNEAEFNMSRSVERRSGRCNVINTPSTCPRLQSLVFTSFGDALPSDAAKKKSTAFLAGVGNDMKVIQRLIKDDDLKNLVQVKMTCHFEQMNVQECNSVIENLMKDTILKSQDTILKSQDEGILIWYTGHGQIDTGNWVLKDGFLTFEDIYNLYMRYLKGRHLYIITDCCFSGAWVVECARLLDRDGITCSHAAKRKQVYIKVFAASLPDEYANDKFYIECKGVKLHSRDKPKCIKFAEHRKLQYKGSDSSQTTLAVDFTRDNTCVLNLRDECISNSSWSAHVRSLLKEKCTNDYLI